ncbi:cobB [Symbiodinium natans]|uniref:CobB protein n=1 Tax=Symbiodinium natans TaxID=878477 RepID=A0A812HP25_9DINO|nr:cobB [Symbiodinium natans]
MSAVDVRDHLHHLPGQGCSFSAQLGNLGARLRLANAARWQLPELEVEQDAFCHRGFEGKVSEFLRFAQREVWEARGRYPEASRAAFDVLLESLDAALSGEKDLTLVVRDPSGLSRLDAAEVKHFERTVRDDLALGVEYPRPTLQLNSAENVAKIVRRASRIVALTGAGISVESGITPFRLPSSSDGGSAIWAEFDARQMTVDGFNSDADIRAKWWAMKRKLLKEMSMAKANPAHCFFGELEKRGKLKGVITQNIDSLHQGGGAPCEKVNELHGHMRRLICSDHRTPLNPQPFATGECDYECATTACGDDNVPTCPKCGSPLRTETVLFEQAMPEGAVERAQCTIQESDLLIVIGSTLIVRPANELPAEALCRGIPVIMVNLDDTCYDANAVSLVRQPAGKFFDEVMSFLGDGDWHLDPCEESAHPTHPTSSDQHEHIPMESTPAALELDDGDSDDQLYGDDDLGC